MKHQPDVLETVGKLVHKINELQNAANQLKNNNSDIQLFVCRKVQRSSTRWDYEPFTSIFRDHAVAAIHTQIAALKKEIADVGVSVEWE